MSDSLHRSPRTADADSLSCAIVRAVAARDGVDPLALDPPLYEVVDPDALDALFGHPDSARPKTTGSVQFAYRGYDVRVTSTGEVSVRAAAEDAETE